MNLAMTINQKNFIVKHDFAFLYFKGSIEIAPPIGLSNRYFLGTWGPNGLRIVLLNGRSPARVPCLVFAYRVLSNSGLDCFLVVKL